LQLKDVKLGLNSTEQTNKKSSYSWYVAEIKY